ncbi:type II CAAX endopeptidase family protein [Nonomuraea sp. NPDC049152]|uniref:CPBP family intramembrane glutamic endopeptidase n=1 Tax=Nonomuraea sp. NPDC049152 TaxID=3154350 RepID=UPI0033C691C4
MVRFFALVFALAVPFWVAGAFMGDLPGAPMNLPVGALMFPCPLVAAAILLRRREGPGATRRLLSRTFAVMGMRRTPWLAAAFVLVPAVDLSAYGLALLGGPLEGEHASPLAAPLLFAVFFLAAASEEAGWMGYAADPLRKRWGPLGAGLILGVVWGAWHVVPLFQAGRSLAWIAWWFLGAVAARVIIVWLYTRTGASVLSAIVFHAMLNVVPSLLPGYAAGEVLIACSALVTTLVAAAVMLSGALSPVGESRRSTEGGEDTQSGGHNRWL